MQALEFASEIHNTSGLVLMKETNEKWTLVATILGSSMTFIDGTAVNVALPVLQEQLRATSAQAQWVVESYALSLSALILVGGALGDKYGRRRIFTYGVVLFAISSLVCAIVSSIDGLILARGAQGIGAALLVPGSLAMISANFDRAHRGRAIGTWSGFTAISAAIGPVLGGWLVDNVSWRWIFYINLPLAIVVVAACVWGVPESRDEKAASTLDYTGALLAVIALGGIVYALIESQSDETTGFATVASAVVGLIALAAFILVEKRKSNPMMPLGLFSSRTFAGANLLTLFLYSALGGVLYFLPFNLIQVQHYSATRAGAALLPFVLTMFVLSRAAGGLIDRYGATLPLVVGPIVTGIGFALFATAPVESTSYWRDFFPAIMVMSLGMATSVAPLTTAVMGAVDERRAGIASGINNAVSRTASLLAIAAFGVLMLSSFTGRLENASARLEPSAREALLEQRYKLAGAGLGADFDAPARSVATRAVNESFVHGFSLVALGAAGLAFMSAFCSWLLIEGKDQ